MSKRFRLLLIVALLGVGFAFLYPSLKWYFLLSPQVKQLAIGSLPRIRLYVQNQAREVVSELQAAPLTEPLPAKYEFLIKQARLSYQADGLPIPRSWTLEKVFRGFTSRQDLLSALESHYRDEILAAKELQSRTMQLGLDLRGGMRVLLRAQTEELEKTLGRPLSAAEKEDAVKRAMEVLNNRIDQFGVTEAQIRRQGQDQILIELPGEADRTRVNSFIQGRGVLNFYIVDDAGLAWFRQYQAEHPNEDFIDAEGDTIQPPGLPAGTILRGVYTKDSYGMDQLRGYTVLKAQAGLSGNYIRDARVTPDPITGKPDVVFVLTSQGGDIFYKLTSDNVGKTLAVVLGDKVKAQARIAEPIRDTVRVTGFDQKEASDLALVLRTGALPVPLEVVNFQSVGATLGEDAIRTGLRAAAVGFAAVILFMLIYYAAAGLNAVIALLLNAYFMFAVLSAFNFTLTLAAITGMVLTIGMAVDANVLIFERMKEEYRLGKSPKAVVKAGFAKAFWAIADSNITTFIAAIVLSQLGKGPVQGFAVTLAVGVVTSMFTALFVSRLIYDFSTDILHIRHLSLSWWRRVPA
jgi:preprotein translocase subunit SecD